MSLLDKIRSVEEVEATPKSCEPIERKDIEALIDEGYSFELLGLNNSTGNVL